MACYETEMFCKYIDKALDVQQHEGVRAHLLTCQRVKRRPTEPCAGIALERLFQTPKRAREAAVRDFLTAFSRSPTKRFSRRLLAVG